MATAGEKMLLDVVDYLVANQAVRQRDQHKTVRAGIALLDRHKLWTPRTDVARRASAAIVAQLLQIIFNFFGDASTETRLFRMGERRCGKECARVVEAFGLQKHKKAREFWSYSRFGLGQPIPR